MKNNDKPYSEQYRLLALEWVEADAAATLLEESKSAVLSRMMADRMAASNAKAEREVKASAGWNDYIQEMVEARKKAAKLKVELEYIRMRHWEMWGTEATKRAEMSLSRG